MRGNINMSKFYLADPLVLSENAIDPFDFRIYQYCCKNYDVKKFQPFIRLVNIAGCFQLSLEQVQASLSRLAKVRVNGLPLIKISDNGKYLCFAMPRHTEFIKSLGFQRYNSSRAWKLLKEHTAQEIKTDYLYSNLDQYELFDKLNSLPKEQLLNINEDKIMYKWVLKNVKKHRQIT